jgi:hypothetical protein
MSTTDTNDQRLEPEPLQAKSEITGRTRVGKVARLPKASRDKLNTMMLDGVPYLRIIEAFATEAPGLTEVNLSHWKTGGYLDWLRNMQITEAIKAKHELANDIVANAGDENVAATAVLQTLAANLCKFLADNDPEILRDSLMNDADKFTRFVNAMVRLADGGIKCQLHRFQTQDRLAQLAKIKDGAGPRGISDESLHKAEEKLNLL